MKKLMMIALLATAGCGDRVDRMLESRQEAAAHAYWDAEFDRILSDSEERMNAPWPEVRPEAKIHAREWAKRHGGAMWNCLNPIFAGKDNVCGENPVVCVSPRTKRPAVDYDWSLDERKCVKRPSVFYYTSDSAQPSVVMPNKPGTMRFVRGPEMKPMAAPK